MEICPKIDVVCFDKTGTLTEGKIVVCHIVCEDKKNLDFLVHSLGMLIDMIASLFMIY
jgi:P-type E1-E2 ATPase